MISGDFVERLIATFGVAVHYAECSHRAHDRHCAKLSRVCGMVSDRDRRSVDKGFLRVLQRAVRFFHHARSSLRRDLDAANAKDYGCQRCRIRETASNLAPKNLVPLKVGCPVELPAGVTGSRPSSRMSAPAARKVAGNARATRLRSVSSDPYTWKQSVRELSARPRVEIGSLRAGQV